MDKITKKLISSRKKELIEKIQHLLGADVSNEECKLYFEHGFTPIIFNTLIHGVSRVVYPIYVSNNTIYFRFPNAKANETKFEEINMCDLTNDYLELMKKQIAFYLDYVRNYA